MDTLYSCDNDKIINLKSLPRHLLVNLSLAVCFLHLSITTMIILYITAVYKTGSCQPGCVTESSSLLKVYCINKLRLQLAICSRDDQHWQVSLVISLNFRLHVHIILDKPKEYCVVLLKSIPLKCRHPCIKDTLIFQCIVRDPSLKRRHWDILTCTIRVL